MNTSYGLIEELVKNCNPWSVVRVEWRDAYDAPNGWTDVNEYKGEDQIASTVGYVWPNCLENYLTLSSTIFESELPKPECAGNVTHIPIAMIQSFNNLI